MAPFVPGKSGWHLSSPNFPKMWMAPTSPTSPWGFDLRDQIPHPDPDRTRQHGLAVFRHPHQVQMDLEHAVGPMPVLRHAAHDTAEER